MVTVSQTRSSDVAVIADAAVRSAKQESRAIAGSTARCRCKFYRSVQRHRAVFTAI